MADYWDTPILTPNGERVPMGSAVAYSVILKDVGVLQQTMYMAATAMGVAPCGVGFGNADLFAQVIGSDYYTETSVGEFLLGSRG